MKLIPAIDLKNNKVVLPTGSSRNDYNEISNTLSPSSNPIDFIKYLQSIYNFNTIYLADLDSIENFNYKNNLISDILNEFKNNNFIIDNGVIKYSQIRLFDYLNYKQIIATETYEEYDLLIKEKSNDYILSVDYSKNEIISKNENYKLLTPKKVICMNMDSIGKGYGPNYFNLKLTKKLYPKSKIIVSGGIRNNNDLKKIKKFSCSEVILLSSIINKNIIYSDL